MLSRFTITRGCSLFLLSAVAHFLPRTLSIQNTLLTSKKTYCTPMEMSAVTELGKITLKPVEKGALKGTPDTTAGQSNSAPSLLSLFDLQIADRKYSFSLMFRSTLG
jgi:hypothetical protein